MTDNVHNKEEILEKYRDAGRILKIVRAEAVEMIRIGNSLLKVAEFVENRTIELGEGRLFPATYPETKRPHMQPQRQEALTFSEKIWSSWILESTWTDTLQMRL